MKNNLKPKKKTQLTTDILASATENIKILLRLIR